MSHLACREAGAWVDIGLLRPEVDGNKAPDLDFGSVSMQGFPMICQASGVGFQVKGRRTHVHSFGDRKVP
jgi:hypothetical protein